MSSANGLVKFSDGTILHTIYHGTSDIMYDRLFNTSDEAWNSDNKWGKCNCVSEDVLIYTDYGRGKTYTGKACKEHMCVTFDYNNWLECVYNDRESCWLWHRMSDDEINKDKLKHEEILKVNWMKSGKHFQEERTIDNANIYMY